MEKELGMEWNCNRNTATRFFKELEAMCSQGMWRADETVRKLRPENQED